MKPKPAANGMIWHCSICAGKMIGTSLLQGLAKDDFMPKLWNEFRTSGLPGEKGCPSCRKPMRMLRAGVGSAAMELDACLVCMSLWFDRNELEQVRLKAKERWPRDRIVYESYRHPLSRPVPLQQHCVNLLLELSYWF